MTDKAVIFSSEPISGSSDYPRGGLLRCQVIERVEHLGRSLVRVLVIDGPRNHEDGDVFVVDDGRLV